MRVLIVSDTHGKHMGIDKAIENAGKIDALIHLGDVEDDEDYIEAIAGCKCYIVGGNNDYFSPLPRELEIVLGGKKIFLTHGHHYMVSLGPERIIREGLDRGVNIVMHGHTHRPYIEHVEGLTVMNPGSLAYPRQEGRKKSYIIMEINEDGSCDYQIHYLT